MMKPLPHMRRATLAGSPDRQFELQPTQNSNPDRRAQHIQDRFGFSPDLAAVVELAYVTVAS